MLWALLATSLAITDVPVCQPSLQRPGTCQLDVDPWVELGVWTGIAALWGTSTLLKSREGRTPVWDGAAPWERDLHDAIELSSSSARGDAVHAADVVRWGLIPASILLYSGLSSLDGMRRGLLPTEALEDIYVVISAFVLGSGINDILKRSVGRTRPNAYPIHGEASGVASIHSFPSGHTLGAVAMSFAYVSMLKRRRDPAWIWFAISGAAGSALIGVARVMSNSHWPTDVVAGYALGAAAGILHPYFLHPARGAAPDAAQITVLPLLQSTSTEVKTHGLSLQLSW